MKRLLVAALLVTSLLPNRAEAQCPGDCGAELLDSPKAVEKYVKKAWGAIASCAKRGEPACPSACALPDATADPYLLGASCAGLVTCELQGLAADVYGPQWDELNGCAAGAADSCGVARASAGKLVSTKLKRRRTSKMDKFPSDRDSCVAKVNKTAACGGETVCADAGAWIDSVLPIRIGKGGYQSLPFSASAAGEGKAVLSLLAETADWGTYERESVVVQYDLDGVPLGVIVVNDGEQAVDYPIMLGEVSAGGHTIGLRHSKKLSPADDSPVQIHATAAVSVLTPSDPGYDALRFAPALLGIDNELNIVGSHPGNAVSDIPMLQYVRATPGVGKTTYTYVMIWSNEDGGTGIYPDVLIARYGRTSDIENIVDVDVSDTGTLMEIRFRPDESGVPAIFAGSYVGTHPIVRTATANGLIADDGDSTLRFLLAPFELDDGGVRERGMDAVPNSYRVMAKEMNREGKAEATPKPSTPRLSDERNYLFVEYDISVDVSGRVLRAYAVVNGVAYGSDHFQNDSGVWDPKVPDGHARTTIELPPGTTVADVTEIGMQGVGTMSGTLQSIEVFMLDSAFLPGPHTTFNGPVSASGTNPTWAVGP